METATKKLTYTPHAKKSLPNLTEGNLLKQIVLFALPLMATNLLQLVFNTADTIVVGRWGGATPEECETSLAAVGACGALISLIINVFIGLSIGANVCVARELGAKKHEEADKSVHTAVLLSIISGVLVGIIGFFLANPLLRLTGVEDALLREATRYMQAYFVGVPAFLVYNFCASILRADGDTKHPLIFLSVGGVINVILNLVMVLGFHLGALGVGIATATSSWISCFLCLFFMMRKDGAGHLDVKKLRIHPSKLRMIVAIGLPSGIGSCFFSIGNVMTQSAVNSFESETIIAANSAAGNIEGYVYNAQYTFSATAITFVSQNLGAKRLDRVKRSILYCALSAVIIAAVFGVASYLFGEFFLGLYIPDNAPAVETGMLRLGIVGITYFLCGVMDVGSGILRGFGKSTLTTVNSLCFACLSRVLWILFVFSKFHTLEMLYVIYPISWTLTSIFNWLFCAIIYRKAKKSYMSKEASP